MKSTIKISSPTVLKNCIEYSYVITGELREVFSEKEKFYIEYSCDISNVPESIAVIPFLCNVLPIAWIYDADIYLESCDKTFYDSIPEFKKGYADMYSQVEFKGNIYAGMLENNSYSSNNGAVAFFSGGVDAFNTLVNHAEEKPVLLTVWGADVNLEDTEGWKNVESHIKKTAEIFETNYVTIKSCLRQFINVVPIQNRIYEKAKDGWWHGFQHGIGIIGHAAPVCYVMNKTVVYFASSFTAAEKGKVTCASDPTIDNHVKFGDTHVVHDGYEFNRQAKIHNIVEYSGKTGTKIPLRVCWQSTGGKNCCQCEKCWRTILGLCAEGRNPNDYGFEYSGKQFVEMTKNMRKCYNPMFTELRYKPIQDAMRKNLSFDKVPEELQWFYKMDIKKLGHHPFRAFCDKYKGKAKNVLKRIIK